MHSFCDQNGQGARSGWHTVCSFKDYSAGSRDVMGARLDWTWVCDARLGRLSTHREEKKIQSSCSSVSIPGCSLLGATPQMRGSARKPYLQLPAHGPQNTAGVTFQRLTRKNHALKKRRGRLGDATPPALSPGVSGRAWTEKSSPTTRKPRNRGRHKSSICLPCTRR
jgi:hypothetical protein